jgi:anti-sigma B factor antagonist
MKQNLTVTSAAHPQQKDITILLPKGFIDTNTAPEFDRAFQSVLAQKRFNVVVDLQQVTYISSVGWGIFIGELKRIRTQNGNLALSCMTPEVEEAYKLLEFDSIIKAFTTVEDAIQKGFGRAAGKKGAEKTKAGKAAVATPVIEAAPVATPTVAPTQTFRSVPEPKKVGFLGWLLQPWKWF